MSMTRKWRRIVLALIVLAGISAGTVHASLHPFHHHSDTCDLFDALAVALASPEGFVLQPLPPLLLQIAVFISDHVTGTFAGAFCIRPPPFIR